MEENDKTSWEKSFLKNGLRYTKGKLLQIQVGVNFFRCMEGYSSWEEEEYAQISWVHIQMHKSLWDHLKQLR